MYLGKIMEIAKTEEIFSSPLHPYTHALLSGIPNPEVGKRKGRMVLTGDVPNPVDPPQGCRFHTRCPFATELCVKEEPRLEMVEEDHRVACHRHGEVEGLIGPTPE
jgi:oligopeptide/dipeptide ABC transporter ATP-binding protein